jgi:hypothetical protein
MMRRQIRVQAEGRRRQRHRQTSPEERATAAVRKRQEEGHAGDSDQDEKGQSTEERQNALAEGLEAQGHSKEVAAALAAETIDKGLKYRMDVASLEGGAFFSVQSRGGVLLVTLNMDHPAYDLLLGARKESEDSKEDAKTLQERLVAAEQGLEMMLFAWARYEDEQGTSEQRRQAQNVRFDWGRMAENFLEARASA